MPRTVDGILLLDKPVGQSSNAVLQQLKRLYQARKAGHTGSLDPLASGLLPICFGEATKVSGYLLDAAKAYRFSCRLGVTTTTGDAEGEVLQERPVGVFDGPQLEAVLERFRGTISQLPPMYSALKVGGKRLYELARQGITVAREPRQVFINTLRLLDHQGDQLTLEVQCSKGTYVRSLAMDIGEALGCGAHVTMLRRTLAEPFSLDHAHTLESLQQDQENWQALDGRLLPIDHALQSWPAVAIADTLSERLCHGQSLSMTDKDRLGWCRLYTESGDFLGIGEITTDAQLHLRRRIRCQRVAHTIT